MVKKQNTPKAENKVKITTYNLNIKLRGKNLKESFFDFEKAQSRADIVKRVKQLQATAKKNNSNVEFIVGLQYDDGWRSDAKFGVDDDPNLFDPDNYYQGDEATQPNARHVKKQDTFKRFLIITMPGPAPVGGNDDYNDCLYNAIQKICQGQIMESYDSPQKFKNRLGLKRRDKVPISMFPQIEDGLKINLNCVGDAQYISANKYPRTVNLKLLNQHYTIDKEKLKKCKIIPNHKDIGFYERIGDKYHVITKSSDETHDITSNPTKFFTEIYPNHFLIDQTKYTQIKKKKDKPVKTLQELFNEFNEAQNVLYKESNGFIDLFKYPHPSQMAQRILHYKAESLQNALEPISANEAFWIDKAFMGGLIYAENGEYTDVICYDQNSQYSHYISSSNLLIPCKKGEFKVVGNADIEKFASYGIYRCRIESNEENKAKLFRFNRSNYYTHFDISNAKQLGFKVEMIDDGQPNALIYSRGSMVMGNQYFKATVDYLFELKNKCPYAKRILSAIWGSMVERNTKYTWVHESDDDIIIPDDQNIIGLEKYGDVNRVVTMPFNKMFVRDSARLGPFLTSYVRHKMSQTIINNFELENVVRIHTDGVIVKNEQMKPEYLGRELGKFKIEKQGVCIVYHANHVDWQPVNP
jgi:hypothetical protein